MGKGTVKALLFKPFFRDLKHTTCLPSISLQNLQVLHSPRTFRLKCKLLALSVLCSPPLCAVVELDRSMEISPLWKREELGVRIPDRSTAIVSSCQAAVWRLPSLAVVGVPVAVHLAALATVHRVAERAEALCFLGGTPLSQPSVVAFRCVCSSGARSWKISPSWG